MLNFLTTLNKAILPLEKICIIIFSVLIHSIPGDMTPLLLSYSK